MAAFLLPRVDWRSSVISSEDEATPRFCPFVSRRCWLRNVGIIERLPRELEDGGTQLQGRAVPVVTSLHRLLIGGDHAALGETRPTIAREARSL